VYNVSLDCVVQSFSGFASPGADVFQTLLFGVDGLDYGEHVFELINAGTAQAPFLDFDHAVIQVRPRCFFFLVDVVYQRLTHSWNSN
jgi:hypothetical protein